MAQRTEDYAWSHASWQTSDDDKPDDVISRKRNRPAYEPKELIGAGCSGTQPYLCASMALPERATKNTSSWSGNWCKKGSSVALTEQERLICVHYIWDEDKTYEAFDGKAGSTKHITLSRSPKPDENTNEKVYYAPGQKRLRSK